MNHKISKRRKFAVKGSTVITWIVGFSDSLTVREDNINETRYKYALYLIKETSSFTCRATSTRQPLTFQQHCMPNGNEQPCRILKGKQTWDKNSMSEQNDMHVQGQNRDSSLTYAKLRTFNLTWFLFYYTCSL